MIFVGISAIILGLSIAWFVSEFVTQKKRIRCTLGVLAILSSSGFICLTAQRFMVKYNVWFDGLTVIEGKEPLSPGAIPFKLINGLILVRADFDTESGTNSGTFMVDTGSTMSIITEDIVTEFEKLHIEGHFFGINRTQKLSLSHAIIKRLNVGNTIVEDLCVAVYDTSTLTEGLGVPVCGILGNNFLKEFRVVIDYTNNELLLLRKNWERSLEVSNEMLLLKCRSLEDRVSELEGIFQRLRARNTSPPSATKNAQEHPE